MQRQLPTPAQTENSVLYMLIGEINKENAAMPQKNNTCFIEQAMALCYNLNMKFRVFLAITGCKLARFLLRALGKGATTLPGKIAIKICPDILGYLAKDVKCTTSSFPSSAAYASWPSRAPPAPTGVVSVYVFG